MEVKTQLVPDNIRRTKTYTGINERRTITIHETANPNKGAHAQAHANLQTRGNTRQASWHYQVDDREAIQSFPHTAQCWHAGDGRGAGNLHSIAIEICVNSDGDFMQAVRNAAELTRRIMAQENIPLANIVQHNRWSGKNCPTNLRNGNRGITWAQFLALVRDGAPTPPSPPKPPAPKPTPKPPTTPPKEDDIMSKWPNFDWRRQRTSSYSAADARVQGLLKAVDCYDGIIDGKRGPLSLSGMRKFQIRTNSGDGKGGADMLGGPKTKESLLTGKKW